MSALALIEALLPDGWTWRERAESGWLGRRWVVACTPTDGPSFGFEHSDVAAARQGLAAALAQWRIGAMLRAEGWHTDPDFSALLFGQAPTDVLRGHWWVIAAAEPDDVAHLVRAKAEAIDRLGQAGAERATYVVLPAEVTRHPDAVAVAMGLPARFGQVRQPVDD